MISKQKNMINLNFLFTLKQALADLSVEARHTHNQENANEQSNGRFHFFFAFRFGILNPFESSRIEHEEWIII